MENGPFEGVFPIKNGDIPLLCWFTRGYPKATFNGSSYKCKNLRKTLSARRGGIGRRRHSLSDTGRSNAVHGVDNKDAKAYHNNSSRYFWGKFYHVSITCQIDPIIFLTVFSRNLDDQIACLLSQKAQCH